MNIVLPTPLVAPALMSALLTILPIPEANVAGLAGATGIAAYTVATHRPDEKKHKGDRDRLSRLFQRADSQTITQLHDKLKSTAEKLTKAEHELERATSQRDRAERMVALSMRQPEPKVKDSEEYQELSDRRDQLIEESIALEDTIEELQIALDNAEYERERAVSEVRKQMLMTPSQKLELEQGLETLTAQRDALVERIEALGGQAETVIDGIDAENAAMVSRAESELQRLSAERADLKAEVARLQAEMNKPGRFGGIGTADKAGNALIDFLAAKGIAVDAVETDPEPGKYLRVSLRPRTSIALKDIENFLPELETHMRLYGVPEVTYKNANFVFKLAIDKPLVTTNQSPLPSRLSNLKKTVDLANHIRLVGPSGSGKSVFLDNLIWLGLAVMPNANVALADPKYPFTEWSDIEPAFKGSDSCIDAVQTLSDRMTRRLEKATKAADNKEPMPTFDPYIFVLDEAQVAYAQARQNDIKEGRGSKEAQSFSMNLTSLLALGRALSFKGYFITQSALCSKVGLNVDTFDNAVSIFLNSSIDTALSEELKGRYSPDKLTATRKEYERRKAAGQSYIALISDLGHDDLYLLEAPRPGFYRDQLSPENSPFLPAKAKEAKPANVDSERDTEGEASTAGETLGEAFAASSPAFAASSPASERSPRAHCPKCLSESDKLDRLTPNKAGKYKFKCANPSCEQKTFSSLPLA